MSLLEGGSDNVPEVLDVFICTGALETEEDVKKAVAAAKSSAWRRRAIGAGQ